MRAKIDALLAELKKKPEEFEMLQHMAVHILMSKYKLTAMEALVMYNKIHKNETIDEP